MEWNNPLLVWDPMEHDGMEHTYLSHDSQWMPDVMAYHTLHTQVIEPQAQMVTKVLSTGLVINMVDQLQTYICEFDMSHYPFDEHYCVIRYGSWMNTADDVTFEYYKQDNYSDVNFASSANGAWTMSYNVTTIITNYSLNYEAFSEGVVTFHLVRNPFDILIYLVAPIFIITTLGIIGVFTPSMHTLERNERVTLGLSALVALTVFTTQVSIETPPIGKMTSIGVFIWTEFFLITLAIVISVALLHSHSRLCCTSCSCITNLSRQEINPNANKDVNTNGNQESAKTNLKRDTTNLYYYWLDVFWLVVMLIANIGFTIAWMVIR